MNPAPTQPYWSFLICSHPDRAVINVYFNGLPIGVIQKGVFVPHRLAPNDRVITMRDLADPCPFQNAEGLQEALHQIVDVIEVAAVPQPSVLDMTIPTLRMKAYVKNDRVILEIPADALVLGCKANGIEVIDREKMLKHFATHLVDDETMGEDKKINQLLDDIANDAVESAELWCVPE